MLAYLDPGSGSFIFQMILATFLTVGVFMTSFWRKIVGFFCRRDRDLPVKNTDKDVA